MCRTGHLFFRVLCGHIKLWAHAKCLGMTPQRFTSRICLTGLCKLTESVRTTKINTFYGVAEVIYRAVIWVTRLYFCLNLIICAQGKFLGQPHTYGCSYPFLTDRVMQLLSNVYDELLLSTLINPRVNALFVMIWSICLAQRSTCARVR